TRANWGCPAVISAAEDFAPDSGSINSRTPVSCRPIHRRSQSAEHMAQKEFGIAADHVLRQAATLDQKEPVPAAGCRLLVDRLETIKRRHDVKRRTVRDLVRMVAQ